MARLRNYTLLLESHGSLLLIGGAPKYGPYAGYLQPQELGNAKLSSGILLAVEFRCHGGRNQELLYAIGTCLPEIYMANNFVQRQWINSPELKVRLERGTISNPEVSNLGIPFLNS